jgi:hypothetical protein
VGVVKEMKPGPVDNWLPVGFLVGSEENRCRKESLKPFFDSAIVSAIFGQVKEVEHRQATREMDCPSFLSQSQGCDPNGNQSVLAVRDGRFITHLQQ